MTSHDAANLAQIELLSQSIQNEQAPDPLIERQEPVLEPDQQEPTDTLHS